MYEVLVQVIPQVALKRQTTTMMEKKNHATILNASRNKRSRLYPFSIKVQHETGRTLREILASLWENEIFTQFIEQFID